METLYEHSIEGFLFSTDPKKIDLDYVHGFLSRSYWAGGIPKSVVKQSIDNSLSIGIYDNHRQVGFARVITDKTTFAYLADVFVDEAYRKKGLSKKLMSFILSFKEFESLRRFILATRDAHGLYAQYGFKPLKSPDRFMERHNPDVYKTINPIPYV